jgi:hypothetical protein
MQMILGMTMAFRSLSGGLCVCMNANNHHSMTGWLLEILVLKDRFKRFTSHSSGFAGGH